MSFFITGIGVSKGYAIGQVHLLQRNKLEIVEAIIPKNTVKQEILALKQAIARAAQEIKTIRKTINKDDEEIFSFLDSHLQILKDPAISKKPISFIKEDYCSALWALEVQKKHLISVFNKMDDPYLRSKKDDIRQVIEKIQTQLVSYNKNTQSGISHFKGMIIVADDLTPADTIDLQNQGIVGFITESGGPLSHTAILSRSLGIPAIVGLHNAKSLIKNQETIVIDGFKGHALVNPNKASLKHYKNKDKVNKQRKKRLERLANKTSVSLDDVSILLQANIETPEDIKIVKKLNPDGIGLYRTEFLYMNREDLPTEEEHYKAYIKIIRSLKGMPLTIRTVDLGADKKFASLPQLTPIVHNHALGLRGIRLALNNPNIFLPQLRAIIRASAKGPVKILLPMITTLAEALQTLTIIDELKSTLKKNGFKFSDTIPVGAMIEVPSSAILSDQFAKNLDFLSIGTNDLVQYTLAIDRLDDEVNYLYNPLDPAVLHLIKNVILSGRKYNKDVSMCGEMAGETKFTKLLLGMGLINFSVQPNNLLEIKEIIRKTKLLSLPAKVDDFYHTSNIEEQESLLRKLND